MRNMHISIKAAEHVWTVTYFRISFPCISWNITLFLRTSYAESKWKSRKNFQWPNSLLSTVWFGITETESVPTEHNSDVMIGAMASQITSPTIVYSTIYLGADQRKHQSFASLSFVRGIHRWPVNTPNKLPVTQKMSPFDDVIMSVDCLWRSEKIAGGFGCQSLCVDHAPGINISLQNHYQPCLH